MGLSPVDWRQNRTTYLLTKWSNVIQSVLVWNTKKISAWLSALDDKLYMSVSLFLILITKISQNRMRSL